MLVMAFSFQAIDKLNHKCWIYGKNSNAKLTINEITKILHHWEILPKKNFFFSELNCFLDGFFIDLDVEHAFCI